MNDWREKSGVYARVVHGSDGPAGRVTILPDLGGSGQHNRFLIFLLITDFLVYLNRYMHLRLLHSD